MQRFLWVVLFIGLSATLLSGQTSDRGKGGVRGTNIGLIDMVDAFKKSNKFIALRKGLKDELSQSDAEMRKMGVRNNILKAELAKLTAGTPEARTKQLEINALQQDANTFRTSVKRRFQVAEARVYQQMYLEIGDVVEAIAAARKLSIVFRFNRRKIEGLSDPGEVQKSMNRQVVYTEQSNDITDDVVKRLNEIYAQASE